RASSRLELRRIRKHRGAAPARRRGRHLSAGRQVRRRRRCLAVFRLHRLHGGIGGIAARNAPAGWSAAGRRGRPGAEGRPRAPPRAPRRDGGRGPRPAVPRRRPPRPARGPRPAAAAAPPPPPLYRAPPAALARRDDPLNGADAAVVMAAARIGDAERLDATRTALSRTGPVELALGHARAGVHVLDLREDGAVPRALWALSWPLALLGRPSELRLSGPNHCEGLATFHDLRLGWVPLAARFGLKVTLELPLAGFDGENGELIAALDPAP